MTSENNIWQALATSNGHKQAAAYALGMRYDNFMGLLAGTTLYKHFLTLVEHPEAIKDRLKLVKALGQFARWKVVKHRPARAEIAKLLFGTEHPVL